MKLHAGSLYKDYLVLYQYVEGAKEKYIIQVKDEDLQWDIYCNDVELGIVNKKVATIDWRGMTHVFSYQISENPMKALGFGE